MNLSSNMSQPSRIFYLVGALGPGGLERQLAYLLQVMDRERYQPAVVVWNKKQGAFFEEKIRALGVPVYSFPSTFSGVRKLRAFRELVKKKSPELVHSYSFYTNFAVWYGTLGLRSIPIGSIRQNFLSERVNAGNVLGKLSARWPPIQICNSLAAKETVENTKSYWKPRSVFFVRNSLDLSQFPPSLFPWGDPQLLAVGRLYPEKRWDRLLRALAVLVGKGMKFKLSHAGDGPLRKELELQVKELGLGDKVRFLGVRTDIPNLMKEATFLIHTADDEGCPNVVMEAMACGRAVVATDAGDIPYLVEHGKTGFVVSRGNEVSLVDSIAMLISQQDLARQMGEAGRAKAEREFGLNRLISETLAIYRKSGWEES